MPDPDSPISRRHAERLPRGAALAAAVAAPPLGGGRLLVAIAAPQAANLARYHDRMNAACATLPGARPGACALALPPSALIAVGWAVHQPLLGGWTVDALDAPAALAAWLDGEPLPRPFRDPGIVRPATAGGGWTIEVGGPGNAMPETRHADPQSAYARLYAMAAADFVRRRPGVCFADWHRRVAPDVEQAVRLWHAVAGPGARIVPATGGPAIELCRRAL